MVTKTLIFRSNDLGENVPLVLCFAPPTSDATGKQYPVVWKAATMGATGRYSFTSTWDSTLGFCVAKVEDGQAVVNGSYITIDKGQSTTLHLDGTIIPPVYYFAKPGTASGDQTSQITNMTGETVHLGGGFVKSSGGVDEEMQTTLLYYDVANGMTVVSESNAPILRAYVGLHYTEGQVIKDDLQYETPIWEANLLSLPAFTVLYIRKNAVGLYVAERVNPSVAEKEEEDEQQRFIDERPRFVDEQPRFIDESLCYSKRVYKATLTFDPPTQSVVASGLKVIADHFIEQGYSVKIVTKTEGPNIAIELELPFNVSCNQAEKEILGIIEGHAFGSRGAIKERGGELWLLRTSNAKQWLDINPASLGWYTSGQDAVNADRGVLSGNGAKALLEPAGHGQTRMLTRKSSSLSLAA